MAVKMIRPINNATITQGFGETDFYGAGYPKCNGKNWHNGVDYSTGGGADILAAANGVVIFTGFDASGWGNYIKIQHDHLGVTTLYAHLKQINVVAGNVVAQGQVIGKEGSTGNSTGAHLHFSVYPIGKNGWCDAVPPADYVNVEGEEAPTPQPSNEIQWQIGTCKVLVENLNIRTAPSLNAEVVASWSANDTFNYDGYVDAEGIRWVTYVGNSGNRRYVARRKLDNSEIYCDAY